MYSSATVDVWQNDALTQVSTSTWHLETRVSRTAALTFSRGQPLVALLLMREIPVVMKSLYHVWYTQRVVTPKLTTWIHSPLYITLFSRFSSFVLLSSFFLFKSSLILPSLFAFFAFLSFSFTLSSSVLSRSWVFLHSQVFFHFQFSCNLQFFLVFISLKFSSSLEFISLLSSLQSYIIFYSLEYFSFFEFLSFLAFSVLLPSSPLLFLSSFAF